MPDNDNALAWEKYWRELPAGDGAALWDVDPRHGVLHHLPWFAEHFDPELPVADVGCGSGRQTEALAEHFPRVYGFEVSEAALAAARRAHPASSVDYRVLDLCDPAAVAACHAELGDLNLYVRTVLHQLPVEQRPTAAGNLTALLGERGRAFVVELAPGAADVFASWPSAHRSKLDDLHQAGLVPARLEDGELERLLTAAGLEIVQSAEFLGHSTETGSDGAVLEVPMRRVLVRPAS